MSSIHEITRAGPANADDSNKLKALKSNTNSDSYKMLPDSQDGEEGVSEELEDEVEAFHHDPIAVAERENDYADD